MRTPYHITADWNLEQIKKLRKDAIVQPEKIAAQGYPPAVFVQCMDYLIEYWPTISRQKAIAVVDQTLHSYNNSQSFRGLNGDPSFWVELGKGIVDFFVNLFSKKEATEQDIAKIREVSANTAARVSSFFVELFKDPSLDLDKIMSAFKEAKAIRDKMDGSVWDFLGKFKVGNETAFYNDMLGQVDGYFNQLYAFIEQLLANASKATDQLAVLTKDMLTAGETPAKLGEAKRLYTTIKISLGKTGDSYVRNALLKGKGQDPKNIKFGEGKSPEQVFAADTQLQGLLQRIVQATQIGNPDVPPLPTFTPGSPYGGGSSGSGGSAPYNTGREYTGSGSGTESGGGVVTLPTTDDSIEPKQASMTPVLITLGVLGIGWFAIKSLGGDKKPSSRRAGEAPKRNAAIDGVKKRRRRKSKTSSKKIPIVQLM